MTHRRERRFDRIRGPYVLPVFGREVVERGQCVSILREFPLSRNGLSRFLLLTSLRSRQRKVGARPAQGNTNRPLTNQGKVNAVSTRTESAEQANRPGKAHRRRHTAKQSAAQANKKTEAPSRQKNHTFKTSPNPPTRAPESRIASATLGDKSACNSSTCR